MRSKRDLILTGILCMSEFKSWDIEFPVFDFLQVYGNFMEWSREELFIEFQDYVKMV